MGKCWFGLAGSQVRRYNALTRHLAMAALAVCAVAAFARGAHQRAGRPPSSPDDPPPQGLGLIPLTAAEIKRCSS